MPKFERWRGTTTTDDLLFHVFVVDDSVTTGAGKTGLAFSAFTARYIRAGEALSAAITTEDITTIGTYAAPTSNAHIRIREVDGTNFPGVYEVQIHSDWLSAKRQIVILLTAAGAAPVPIEIAISSFHPDQTIIPVQVDSGTFTPTQTEFQSDTAGLNGSNADHYKDRKILWITGPLAGAGGGITGYDQTNKRFTTTSFPVAPGDNDWAIIV